MTNQRMTEERLKAIESYFDSDTSEGGDLVDELIFEIRALRKVVDAVTDEFIAFGEAWKSGTDTKYVQFKNGDWENIHITDTELRKKTFYSRLKTFEALREAGWLE